MTLSFFATTAIVLGLLTATRANSSADSAKAIDFKQALRLALETQPAALAARAQARNAELALKNARAAWLPTLDAQASHNYNDNALAQPLLGGQIPSNYPTPAFAHAPWTNALSLSLNENLYDNGQSLRLAEIAAADAEAAATAAKRAMAQALLATAKAFYDFSNASYAFDVQRAQIEAVRKQYRTIENRYRQGVNSNRDFLRIKTQLERAELGAITQETGVMEKRSALRQAIGLRSADDFAPLPADDERLAILSLPTVDADSTYEFRIAAAQDRSSDWKVRQAERENWPRLSLKGAYAYHLPQYIGGRIDDVDAPYWDLQASLVLDWSLWDWGVRRRNVDIAGAQRDADRAGRESTRVQVAQDVARLNANAPRLAKAHRESRQALRDEETAYASVEAAYRQGKVNYLDLTQALGDLFSAKAQHLQFQYDLLRAQADLAFYQGNLDEVLGVP